MIKIYTLVEARRILRRIRANNDKVGDALARHIRSKSIQTLNKDLVKLSKYLQLAQDNKELLKAVRIALETHLCETTNLVERLKRVTRMMDDKNQTHMHALEDNLSHLSTHFDTKVNLLLKDLSKRLNQVAQYSTTPSLISNKAGQELGVIRIDNNSGKTAYCVISTDDLALNDDKAITALGKNQYKIFFNELPIDLVLENFHGFVSPSKAVPAILKYLQEDGF